MWKVHGDTRFEPVLHAFNEIQKGNVTDPFIVLLTTSGKRHCLDLLPTIKEMGKPKYFYVYE